MIESVYCRINSMRHAKRFSIVNCIDSNCLTVIFIALRAYRLNKLNFLKIIFSNISRWMGPKIFWWPEFITLSDYTILNIRLELLTGLSIHLLLKHLHHYHIYLGNRGRQYFTLSSFDYRDVKKERRKIFHQCFTQTIQPMVSIICLQYSIFP